MTDSSTNNVGDGELGKEELDYLREDGWGEAETIILGRIADQVEALLRTLADERAKLRNVVSHATGGHWHEDESATRSVNDICVEISRHHNRIWAHAQEPLADRDKRIGDLTEAAAALADGADKCAEAPHFIVQPFAAIYSAHGTTIETARAASTTHEKE